MLSLTGLPSRSMYKLVLEIDYAVENGAGGTNNCSSQFKNLEKLVKILDAQLVSKLDGCSSSNSSSLETREGSRSNTTIDAIGNPLYLPTCPIYIYIYSWGMSPVGLVVECTPPTRADFGIGIDGMSTLLGLGGFGGDPGFPGRGTHPDLEQFGSGSELCFLFYVNLWNFSHLLLLSRAIYLILPNFVCFVGAYSLILS
jgi:proteasome inhibitor subunit 1 (PI31)